MLEQKFNSVAPLLLETIQVKLKNTAYVSILLFSDNALIKSINNNYNNWADYYTKEDMIHDNIFYEMTHKKLKKSNPAICFWNSVPQTSEESLEIDNRRVKYGLHNGVTILESFNDQYTLGINITSDNIINEDVFYSKVILNRTAFMAKLRELLETEEQLQPA